MRSLWLIPALALTFLQGCGPPEGSHGEEWSPYGEVTLAIPVTADSLIEGRMTLYRHFDRADTIGVATEPSYSQTFTDLSREIAIDSVRPGVYDAWLNFVKVDPSGESAEVRLVPAIKVSDIRIVADSISVQQFLYRVRPLTTEEAGDDLNYQDMFIEWGGMTLSKHPHYYLE